HLGVDLVFDIDVCAEFVAEIVSWKNKGVTGMFLLAPTKKVGRITDLGFDLLLAIAVIVVGNQSDNDAGFIPASELEGLAIVVELPFIAPAHSVPPLAFAGPIPVRQTGAFLGQLGELRRAADASGVTGPTFGVRRGRFLRTSW